MIALLFLGAFDLLLAVLVILRNRKNIINKLFAGISFCVFLWIVTIYLSWHPSLISQIDFWSNATFWGPSFLGPLLVYFSKKFPRDDSLKRQEIFLLFLPAFILIILSLLNQINTKTHDSQNIERGFGIYIFIVYFFITVFIFLKNLFNKKRTEIDARKRKQLGLLAYGFMSALFVGVVFNLFFPLVLNNLLMTTVGTPLASSLFIVVLAYAITKHRLMDIGMAVVRSLSFSVMILTLIALLAGSTWLVSLFTKDGLFTPWQASIIAFVIALIFWPLRIWVTKATDKFFYKRTYDPEVLIDSVAHQISSTLVLKDILGGANKILSEQMKLSRCAFVLFDDNKEILKQEAYNWPSFGVDNLYNLASNGLLVADELDDSESKKTIFLENNISLLLPIRNGNKLTGVFLSGEKNSGNLFNQQDFRTLSIITQSMALAIENAKSYSQIKDFNEILRQRIDEATKELRVKNAMLRKLDKAKDEFIGMASHQLRTPLTSIKGYISMLVDGDAGKISSQQKKILADAYISSDKMVRLVNDFLDVSRLQTGKFVVDRTTVNLMELVKTEVDGLLMVAQKKEIKLSCACHDEVPPLEVDENKIRQVVMNFIDNAIFYSHPKSEIKIGLACDGEWVSFTIQDSGIGVPKAEQKELFTKFYRASNAKKQRPSGSGVGLYLAKKVIYAHDGKIIFETIEGKGSTFGFMLPVK